MWSDESLFYVIHPINQQNDRVWAEHKPEVPLRTALKNMVKVMAWEAMRAQGLTLRHVVLKKQTVKADHYLNETLLKTQLPALRRSSRNDIVLKRKMVPGMSAPIFIQDGAPTHTSNKTRKWYRTNLPASMGKAGVPGNLPNLN